MDKRLPEVVTALPGAPGAMRLGLRVPPDLLHFAGHFPGMPILPGVVQLDWAVRLALAHLPGMQPARPFAALENVKFQALVLPGAQMTLDLSWQDMQSRLSFTYHAGDKAYSSGRIVFGEAPR